MESVQRKRVTRRETEELRYKPESMVLPQIPTAGSFKVITPRNKRCEDQLGVEKLIFEQLKSKEKERSEYQRNVLSHHAQSTRSASLSSYRASREQQQIDNEISSVKQTIVKFENEVDRFDQNMTQFSQREVERLELEEKIRANAGK